MSSLFLARVRVGSPHGAARPRTHLLLGVQADGARWHADVGFGHGTLVEPIPFGPGGEHEQSGWRFRIVEDGPELVLQSADQSGAWVDLYGFVPEPVPFIDVVTSNWYTSTYPHSPFVTGLIVSVQRPNGTRDVTERLERGTVAHRGDAGRRHRERGRAGLGPGVDRRPASASRARLSEQGLTVAVTGPTGTFGFGLIPLLQADERVTRIVGIARRPFDPDEHGWSKMTYRQGDVREPETLKEAFDHADVVVHLAFMITGTASRETIRAINVEGTMNAFDAAAAAGAGRFVYASSVAAYGFHPDNPIGMTEDWPTRPAAHLFYAQEKAELEQLLREQADAHPTVALYLLRPPIVLGPHAIGAKGALPEPLASLTQRALELAKRLPVPIPVPTPDLPMQFIHEDDVGQALLRCVVADGPPGAYNIAGDGIVTAADVVRELGFTPITVPAGIAEAAARAAAQIPLPSFAPPATEWFEAASHPAIMDTTKAKRDLGWAPEHTGLDALRETLRREPA